MNNTRLAVELPGLSLKNPIMPASGSFGFGDGDITKTNDLNELGAIVLKTTTKDPKKGNPQPQIAVLKDGVLNSVGLTNPGIKSVVNEKIPNLKKHYSKLPIIASIAGESFEDYLFVAQHFSTLGLVDALELNVSCPNIAAGGMQFGVDPKVIQKLTAAVKEIIAVPLYVKLTPNVTDIVACARAAQEGGADGLTMINTLYGMRIDPVTKKTLVGNQTGGWSGPGILPLAIRMIYQVAHVVNIPIIGVGGISSALDVLEMYLAGASAVQIGSAQFKDPAACWHILSELESEMDKANVNNLQELSDQIKRKFRDERR